MAIIPQKCIAIDFTGVDKEESKSWGLFWSYKPNSNINLAILQPNFEVNGLDWQCCLAGSSKTAPRIFIFSIFLGAEYLSYVNTIATFALTLFGYGFSVLASLSKDLMFSPTNL